MKHTPTPFQVLHEPLETYITVLCPDKPQRRAVGRVFNINPAQRQADAEFIVTACNNHDALVDTVRTLLAEVGDKGRPNVRLDAIKLLREVRS